MQLKRALEQHIAIFGESGSGKTVMISSFYGAKQEPEFLKNSLFRVVADETSQGNRLHRNYLGMRNSALLPVQNRFSGTSYSFSVKFKDSPKAKPTKASSFDALRLVWHDYPGEWFEEDVSGPEEAQRRVDTFRSLLSSDVALLLVDGQRLLEYSGEEERYLKSLLANFKNGLLSLKDELLKDGKPLVEFPRIWIMALSKSDLLPDMKVFDFRDLLIEKVADDINDLREVLAGLVEGSQALSVGEDFVLLSSGKFDTDSIEVTKGVGLDLILPLAAILPFERHVRWARAKQIPGKVAENLLSGAGALAAALIGSKFSLPGPLGTLAKVAGFAVSKEVLDVSTKLAGEKLKEKNSEATAKNDFMTATLTGFRIDLEKGEEEQVFLRSQQ
jgi:hypothetical protein